MGAHARGGRRRQRPGGKFVLSDSEAHVFLGDETCLGAFEAMARAARGKVLGAVEVDAGEESLVEHAGAPLQAVPRDEVRGAALVRWLATLERTPRQPTAFYLGGHAASIVAIRSRLLASGWSRWSIRTKAYWAEGKKGL